MHRGSLAPGALAAAVCMFSLAVVFSFRTTVAEDAAPATERDSTEQIALGKRVYSEHCASCHGANLEGEPNWRSQKPNGRLPAPPHDETGHTWHHPDWQLFRITKFGPAQIVGNGYESDMPGFAGTLSDEEIRATIVFIKSGWPALIKARNDRINKAGEK